MFDRKILGLIGILILVVFVSGCTSSTNKEFSVGNSTFEIPGDWEQEYASNGTGGSGVTAIKKYEYEVIIQQYPNLNSYNDDYKKSALQYSLDTVDINGTSVKTIETSRSYNSDPTQYPYFLYYFEKNGIYYSLSIAYTETDTKDVNETATDIISTLK